MGDERTLLVGIDLGDEYTQVSNYNHRINEPEPVCFSKNHDNFLIPTCLCVKNSTKEWLYGEEAMRCHQREQGEFVDHLLLKLQRDEKVAIFEAEFTACDLMERYLRKLLSALRQMYPNNGILKLTITAKSMNDVIKQRLQEVLNKLGLHEERVLLLNHVQSFMYYAVSQKPELWMNDVGLFNFDEDGLCYYQLSFGRKSTPIAIIANRYDFTDEFPMSLLKQEDPKRLSYRFEELAKQVLFKKVVSTLYATGIGFDGNWADEALKNLCCGRRVFKGQNLYTKGACYASYALAKGHFEEYSFLDEDMIACNISLEVYKDAKEQAILLAESDTPWWQVHSQTLVVLDDTNELHFIVNNLRNNEPMREVMRLDNLRLRENKTIRLLVQLHFYDQETAVVTVKDTGFGVFYENTNRVWEQILKL